MHLSAHCAASRQTHRKLTWLSGSPGMPSTGAGGLGGVTGGIAGVTGGRVAKRGLSHTSHRILLAALTTVQLLQCHSEEEHVHSHLTNSVYMADVAIKKNWPFVNERYQLRYNFW